MINLIILKIASPDLSKSGDDGGELEVGVVVVVEAGGEHVEQRGEQLALAPGAARVRLHAAVAGARVVAVPASGGLARPVEAAALPGRGLNLNTS